jgi:hypothetical protein
MRSFRSWRLLLGLWGAYWVILLAYAVVPFALAVHRATGAPPDKASASANFGTAGFSTTVIREGQTIYSSSVSLLALTLWIFGPPLLIWLGVATAGRRTAREETVSV